MEQDIDKSGEPGPEDDPAGNRVVGPNNEDLPAQEQVADGEDTTDPSDDGDVSDIQDEMVAAADEADETTQSGDIGDAVDAGPPRSVIDSAPAQTRGPPQGFFQAGEAATDVPAAVSLDAPSGPEADQENSEDFSGESAPAPSQEELEGVTASLQSFGEQAQAFNDAGGADFGEAYNGGEDSDAVEDFAQSAMEHFQQQDSMLTEYARRLDDMTRALEAERL